MHKLQKCERKKRKSKKTKKCQRPNQGIRKQEIRKQENLAIDG